MMKRQMSRLKKYLWLSPLFIIGINYLVVIALGEFFQKWIFAPVILVEWVLFLFFLKAYKVRFTLGEWLHKPLQKWRLLGLCIVVGCLPLPLFLKHYETVLSLKVFVPYLIIALLNPWLEEFYWRGLLLSVTKHWPAFLSVFWSASLFALNHLVFGVYSDLNSGIETVISTFIMGIIWGYTFKRTKSLQWCVLSHLLVDVFNLSVASFLDLYTKVW